MYLKGYVAYSGRESWSVDGSLELGVVGSLELGSLVSAQSRWYC